LNVGRPAFSLDTVLTELPRPSNVFLDNWEKGIASSPVSVRRQSGLLWQPADPTCNPCFKLNQVNIKCRPQYGIGV